MSESIQSLQRWAGGYPGEHEYSSLDNLEHNSDTETVFTVADKLVRNWQGNRFAGVYLYGTPGNGKTHAAIALGRTLHDEIEADITYTYAPNLVGMRSFESTKAWSGARVHAANTHGIEETFPDLFNVHIKNTYDKSENRKQILIFDDYKPEVQPILHGAIEAAAQFGGLIVVTSNYADPFKITEKPVDVETAAAYFMMQEIAKHPEGEQFQRVLDQRNEKAAEMSASLNSRIASGFKFIPFEGPDRRIDNGFWN